MKVKLSQLVPSDLNMFPNEYKMTLEVNTGAVRRRTVLLCVGTLLSILYYILLITPIVIFTLTDPEGVAHPVPPPPPNDRAPMIFYAKNAKFPFFVRPPPVHKVTPHRKVKSWIRH